MTEEKKYRTNGEKMTETLDMVIDGRISCGASFTIELAKIIRDKGIVGAGSLLGLCEMLMERQPALLSDMNLRIYGKILREELKLDSSVEIDESEIKH